MNSNTSSARKTGILYLLILILAPLHHVYTIHHFLVPGDAAATASNIDDAQLIYRLGILGGLAADVLFLFLALGLYRMLRTVDRRRARLMVTLVTVSAGIGLVNLFYQMAPLLLLNGAELWPALAQPLDALAHGFLLLRRNGAYVAMAFSGLCLVPFGVMFVMSGNGAKAPPLVARASHAS